MAAIPIKIREIPPVIAADEAVKAANTEPASALIAVDIAEIAGIKLVVSIKVDDIIIALKASSAEVVPLTTPTKPKAIELKAEPSAALNAADCYLAKSSELERPLSSRDAELIL